ncbi:MAG TPA: T9SS type A sorting domain-containing protein [Ignavibacteria bacterium]|jgi:hypothetical protein
MRAIKSKTSMKQLTVTFSMLLFLFLAADNVYSGQKPDKDGEGASVNTIASSQVGYDVMQSAPVKYDRNTLLSYSIPFPMDVEIKLFDNAGMELKTLVREEQYEGTHNINFNSANLRDGVYFYQLTIGSYTETKKIMLVN